MKMTKKGQVFEQFTSLAIGIAGLVIIMAVVFLILAGIKANTSVAADGNATLATNTLIAAAATLPGWVPIVIIVSVGVILIALVSLFRR